MSSVMLLMFLEVFGRVMIQKYKLPSQDFYYLKNHCVIKEAKMNKEVY